MESSLQGLYVPLITPFTEGGDLARDALEKLAHAVIDGGATGLVALGTTGELVGSRIPPPIPPPPRGMIGPILAPPEGIKADSISLRFPLLSL